MLVILAMVISIISYCITGEVIFVWLTILSGFTGVTLSYIWYKEEQRRDMEALIQKCIEDLKNGGDY